MKVLRVFWIHHTDKKLVENRKSGLLETRYKKLKKQTDFDASIPIEDAKESIWREFGKDRPDGALDRAKFSPPQYAEIVSHTITDDSHDKDESIKPEKVFQDALFDPVTWHGLHKGKA